MVQKNTSLTYCEGTPPNCGFSNIFGIASEQMRGKRERHNFPDFAQSSLFGSAQWIHRHSEFSLTGIVLWIWDSPRIWNREFLYIFGTVSGAIRGIRLIIRRTPEYAFSLWTVPVYPFPINAKRGLMGKGIFRVFLQKLCLSGEIRGIRLFPLISLQYA